jgi:hypothetical protein
MSTQRRATEAWSVRGGRRAGGHRDNSRRPAKHGIERLTS